MMERTAGEIESKAAGAASSPAPAIIAVENNGALEECKAPSRLVESSYTVANPDGKRSKTNMSDNNVNSNLSKIDLALANAAARKAAKAKGEDPSKAVARPAKAPKAEKAASDKPKRTPKTDAEKASEKTKRDLDRDERKAKRDAERASKKAAKDANKQPAHLSKVTKAGEKLPAMSETSQEIFNDATANLSAAEIAGLAAHLQYFNRVEATKRALTAEIEEDMVVEIVGGDPRFIGLTGVVSKAQRIRCYVTVHGFEKDLYLYTSDVSPTEEQADAPAAIEAETDAAANA